MSNISQNSIKSLVLVALSKVTTVALNAVGLSIINDITSDSIIINKALTLPTKGNAINNSIYFKADGNLYAYAFGVETRITGAVKPTILSQNSSQNYILSDLIRSDESFQELFCPVMQVIDDYNSDSSNIGFAIEVPAHNISYRVFDITPTMNPSLSTTLTAAIDITTQTSSTQICIFKILDLATDTLITSINYQAGSSTYNNTKFSTLIFNYDAQNEDAVLQLLQDNIKVGFGYEIEANSGQVSSCYIISDALVIGSSVHFIIVDNINHTLGITSADIASLSFTKISLGTRFKFDRDKDFRTNIAGSEQFILEHFNILLAQSKSNNHLFSSLLISYHPMFADYGNGLSANRQFYIENLPKRIVTHFRDQLSGGNDKDLAIGVARIPFWGDVASNAYFQDTDKSNTFPFVISENGLLRRIMPCAVSESQVLTKTTMFPSNNNKYFYTPFINKTFGYDLATELLFVDGFLRSLICNSLVINSVNLILYPSFDEWAKYNASMERGSLFYEKLGNEIQGSILATTRQYIGLRGYFYLGRTNEPMKGDTLYIDSNFYNNSLVLPVSIDINNINTALLKDIRVPDQGNNYKPDTEVNLSIVGALISQEKNSYLTNLLYTG